MDEGDYGVEILAIQLPCYVNLLHATESLLLNIF